MTPKQRLIRSIVVINITALGIAGMAALETSIIHGLIAGLIALLVLPLIFLQYKD